MSRYDLYGEQPFLPIVVAFVATFVSFLTANALVLARASQFDRWRQVRTEFAFSVPTDHLLVVAICFVTGVLAIYAKRSILPLLLGLILCLIVGPVWSYSGSPALSKAIAPLVSYQFDMLYLAVVLNGLVVIGWRFVAKRI